ncbi:Methenyltetrahydromethanopterin cyclohydrolase Mch [Methanonatronarchaeum thermophilum]|uniref:Methenyltetrahydromethanopterin cyclohydrolase n=1 Tax=Methanonatronarchaeum thermophilum TaxID=1927129 RepID=A0A1Y3GAJ5_9EURY|nr:methenyltetrahydromethanopterin cyclohydrolase [Methanonatronarchaeum thermophilum]OUJ18472.1 Methenyltetrahydromethanopterin cyclohydrolase Mch [Methanonatronarchaeum thermophilum]
MNVNETTLELVEELIAWAEEINIEVFQVGESTIIDCSKGGYDAGALYTMACQGGLATTGFTEMDINGTMFPATQNYTDNPVLACIGCQKADLNLDGAIGSGPAKLLTTECNTPEKQESDFAVLTLETDKTPTKETLEKFADRCGVAANCLYVLTAPTNSLVGSIQISARAIETTLYRLQRQGYNLENIISGFATTPIPPIAEDPVKAMGRTNDAVIYGSKVHLTTKKDSDKFKKTPSKNSEKYGKPMIEVYKEADKDFYKIDQDFFAPAQITVNTTNNGKLKKYGEINPQQLKKSFKIED